ncbi:MAG TPA: hypothetical protein VFT85_06305 [Acidimicrobiia bacterium]|nr:hypothetical protein [Acidimicrobiia bacterium]
MSHGVRLYWIPLGAGGSGFVRWNGRVYEWVQSRLERRTAFDLYHTALQVELPEGRFVIETMWPRPDRDGDARGVVVDGPVFAPWLGFTRVFRYEVRSWRDGVLPDAGEAVGGPRLVSSDIDVSRAVLDQVASVPRLVWGRDEADVGDMWNSNSVVSWLLARSGIDMDHVSAPPGGRAPGWDAGLAVARANVGSRR